MKIRIANLNTFFPYLKSIRPTDFEQYIFISQQIALRKTLAHTRIQSNFTVQKTIDSRLIRIGTIPLPKDHGGPVKPTPKWVRIRYPFEYDVRLGILLE